MRSTTPPCSAGRPANATFVEIDHVQITATPTDGDCALYANQTICSTTFNVLDPVKATDNPYLNRLYLNIERSWKVAGIAPAGAPNDTRMIDIQGFVFWYQAFDNQTWHSYSGWEIHPLTAWRYSATPDPTKPSPGGFTFAAAGDFSAQLQTAAGLNRLSLSNTSFMLALGDLSYNQLKPESAWCNYVTTKLGGNYPFELVSGYHEANGLNGLIDNFAQCLPDRLGTINGTYAKEYFFDYPAGNPLARFIMISPHLNFTNGGVYEYRNGTPHYAWLSQTIDSARAGGIHWIIVGMAQNCITAGINGCEIGPDLMNLLLAKKVDLILQGHDHNYQRSKQLSCAQVNQYDPSCIVNDGANGIYNKDAGSILVISGTGGSNEYDINITRANYQYFARTMGPNTPGDGYGFTRFTITPNKVVAQTFFGGSFADTFAIVLPPTASFTYSPTNPLPIFPVTFTASATGGTQPYAFTWDFGDGSTGTGASTSHSYLLMRTYVVTLTVTDSTGQTARVSQTVTISILGLNAFPLKVGSYQAGFG
jgi:hypothetical protein